MLVKQFCYNPESLQETVKLVDQTNNSRPTSNTWGWQ